MRRLIVLALLALSGMPAVAQSAAAPPPASPATVASPADSGVKAELRRVSESLDDLRSAVDSLKNAKKPVAEVWGPILVGLVAAGCGFAAAAYSVTRSSASAREGRLEEHLYDALKWFEGETQKRSVGLSVIEGNWANTALHPTWRGVLVNQAVYLLASSKTDTEHERQNLRRIWALLSRLKLNEFDREALANALAKRRATKGGVPNVDESEWEQIAMLPVSYPGGTASPAA